MQEEIDEGFVDVEEGVWVDPDYDCLDTLRNSNTRLKWQLMDAYNEIKHQKAARNRDAQFYVRYHEDHMWGLRAEKDAEINQVKQCFSSVIKNQREEISRLLRLRNREHDEINKLREEVKKLKEKRR